MFLSIIIPHYNIPRELFERCLKSIATSGLDCNEYEIIIIDDASATPPAWATTLGTNIKLIISEHTGPGGSRNKGIETAQGEYIMFVDADDRLFNNGEIQQCIDKIKAERPQILRYKYLIEQRRKTQNPKGRKIKFSNTISGASFMRDKNLSGSPCTYFFRRELVMKKNIRFPENIFHEDEEFNTILHYHAQTLIESDATLYCYCIRSGSTTANNSKEFEDKRVSNIIHIIERINNFARANKQTSNSIQTRAITHKLDTLVVDAILNMMYVGMRAKEIRKICQERLTPISLYPLRKAKYSLKYRIFRWFANSAIGMRLLRISIPSKKPAKR